MSKTCYAQYANTDAATVDSHSIWNAQADGLGDWLAPASGDTLDTNGFYVTADSTGYVGVSGSSFTIVDSAASYGMLEITAATAYQSCLIAKQHGYIYFGRGIVSCGVVVCGATGTVELCGYGSGGNSGILISKSGGQVNLTGAEGGPPNSGLIICEPGGYVSTLNCGGTIFCQSGGVMDVAYLMGSLICESGGSVSMFGIGDGIILTESEGAVSNGFLCGHLTAVCYLGGTLTDGASIALDEERKTTHYTGDMADYIAVINDTKVLYEKSGPSVATADDVRAGVSNCGANGLLWIDR